MKKKNKGGRRGKYQEWLTEEGLIKLEGWARDGLTDEQIANNMGISPSTLYEWKKKYSEISESLKKGKEVVDRQVENALLKRALGYQYEEVTKEHIIDSGQVKRHGGQSELTEKEWKFAINYFGNRCCYCDKELIEATKDHIIPLKKDGQLTASNILPCCRRCNSSKKDNDLNEWYKTQPFYHEYRLIKINDYVALMTVMQDEPENKDGKLTVTKVVTKEVQPDATAQIFWLKNRRPDKWRDKQMVEQTGDLQLNINIRGSKDGNQRND